MSKRVGISRKHACTIAKDTKFSKKGRERYYGEVKGIPTRIKKQKEFLTEPKIRVIGHLLFDGCVFQSGFGCSIKYTNSSKQLIDQFIRDIKEVYGINKYTLLEREGKFAIIYEVIFRSKLMYEDLIDYFPSYSTSNNTIEIPKIIMENEDNLKLEFLRAFWEDEGSISHTGRLMADLKSEKVINQLATLHKYFGLKYYLYKYKEYTGYMYKISLSRTKENTIRFYSLGLFDKAIITHGHNVRKTKKEVLKEAIKRFKYL